MTPAAKAQALAADLRYVLRKHKARVVWREELDGRVTVSAVIEGVPAAGSLAAALGPKIPWAAIIAAGIVTYVLCWAAYHI